MRLSVTGTVTETQVAKRMISSKYGWSRVCSYTTNKDSNSVTVPMVEGPHFKTPPLMTTSGGGGVVVVAISKKV